MKQYALFLAAYTAFCGVQDAPLLIEATSMATTTTVAAIPSTPSSSIHHDSEAVKRIGSKQSPPPLAEPFWGRIYLRHGVAPIQYFRDSFGGPMVDREVEFFFPKDQINNRFGCKPLAEDEQDLILEQVAMNHSVVLVVDRGECTFEDKSRNAEAMGTAGLLVVSADESASRPVAIVDDGEIQIPSIMVRKSAGELLRSLVLGAKERAFGRLLPMACTKNPYKCSPRSEREQKYIDTFMARSGVLVTSGVDSSSESGNDNAMIGEFLSSTFGGVMPQRARALQVSPLLHAGVVCQNSDTEKMPRLDGKIALIAASGAANHIHTDCSLLDLVSNAQLAGATAALIVADNNKTVSMHPSLSEDWYGYNITIFSGVISASTALRLAQLQEQSTTTVRFELKNEIADAWDQIHQLAVRSAWPLRKDRKEKLLKTLLATFSLNAGQLQTLKSHFLTVASGSIASWDLLALPMQEEGKLLDVKEPSSVTVGGEERIPESHEEL